MDLKSFRLILIREIRAAPRTSINTNEISTLQIREHLYYQRLRTVRRRSKGSRWLNSCRLVSSRRGAGCRLMGRTDGKNSTTLGTVRGIISLRKIREFERLGYFLFHLNFWKIKYTSLKDYFDLVLRVLLYFIVFLF